MHSESRPRSDRAWTAKRWVSGRLACQMPAQPLHNRGSRSANQHANIGHALATLFTEEGAVALHKMNKEPLDLMLKIRGHQVYTVPGREINRAEIEPDLLTFGAVNRTGT